ncbi:hypothetical protein ACBI99_45020 [Nonomuraea sp. ATR24]|uniref:hypothetical protein n=1 Tax=Nonomuraea sp. ATR24 TaxID=1676744 RepID=UPI0035BFC110
MLTHRFMQPPPRPCDHLPGEGLHVWDDPLVIETPARGDALTFTIRVWCSWCAQPKTDSSQQHLNAEIDAKRWAAHRRVHNVVRATARKFPAHLPQAAEEAIDEALTAAFLAPIHDCDSVMIKCTAQAWVSLSEEVLEHQRGIGRKMMEDDAQFELAKTQVARLGKERDLWLRFLEDSEANWRSRYAVRLAEHPVNAADVMGVMERERLEAAQRFLDVVNSVVSAQQAVNVFDLVKDSETALRIALQQLGVHLPEPSAQLPWEQG